MLVKISLILVKKKKIKAAALMIVKGVKKSGRVFQDRESTSSLLSADFGLQGEKALVLTDP